LDIAESLYLYSTKLNNNIVFAKISIFTSNWFDSLNNTKIKIVIFEENRLVTLLTGTFHNFVFWFWLNVSRN